MHGLPLEKSLPKVCGLKCQGKGRSFLAGISSLLLFPDLPPTPQTSDWPGSWIQRPQHSRSEQCVLPHFPDTTPLLLLSTWTKTIRTGERDEREDFTVVFPESCFKLDQFPLGPMTAGASVHLSYFVKQGCRGFLFFTNAFFTFARLNVSQFDCLHFRFWFEKLPVLAKGLECYLVTMNQCNKKSKKK